ncbi:MAG: SdrD B-like domain-containing protein, partial [Acidobacteriota bacterium]|nr:SdrD B-like domain-containing protein [Acidobacteriota bacterium]
MNNVSGSMCDTLRGVALVGLGLLTVPALVRVPAAVEACGAPTAFERVRGHVFEDTNGNGGRDAGEPGVSGVAVSNGCAVTVTDDGGAYAVAVTPGQILFITKPSRFA